MSDDANKTTGLKGKMLTYSNNITLGDDVPVKLIGLNTDATVTKKPRIAAEAAFESVLKEVGPLGMSKILHCCTDWFSEAKETKIVMKLIDKFVNKLPDEATCIAESIVIPNQKYNRRVN